MPKFRGACGKEWLVKKKQRGKDESEILIIYNKLWAEQKERRRKNAESIAYALLDIPSWEQARYIWNNHKLSKIN